MHYVFPCFKVVARITISFNLLALDSKRLLVPRPSRSSKTLLELVPLIVTQDVRWLGSLITKINVSIRVVNDNLVGEKMKTMFDVFQTSTSVRVTRAGTTRSVSMASMRSSVTASSVIRDHSAKTVTIF